MFLRRNNDYDDCGPVSGEGYEDFPPNNQFYNNNRPSPVESDYFYDQYVDFPINETYSNILNNTNSNLRVNETLSPFVDFNQNKFTVNQFPPRPPQPTSAFTFFGQPLPSLNLGSLWGSGRTANTRASSGENSSRGKGRVQIFKPGNPELASVIFNRPTNELDTGDSKNREPAASVKNPIINAPNMDKAEEKFYRPYFQTPFSQPKLEYSKEKHDKGFLIPKAEKGFSPMIPGVSVGGFIPIEDPSSKNDSEEVVTRRNQQVIIETSTIPRDKEVQESDKVLKQVPLVTRAETATKRTVFKSSSDNYVAQIEKVGTSTISSHLQTSLSPILSTLIPKPELITEKSHFYDSNESESEEEEMTSQEIEAQTLATHSTTNKFDRTKYDERFNRETTHSSTYPSTTSTHRNNYQKISSTTLKSSSESTVTEFDERTEDYIDQFNQTGSSDLSADHLIAPGGIISQEIISKEITSKPSMTLSKPGKITKVFTPAPPQIMASNSNEISKLLSPFYGQQPQQQNQYSTESSPIVNYDNEYQPNHHIYTQTFEEKAKSAEQTTAQYEREDMQWYFQNYHNQTNSNPILNYNLQPYDNNYGSNGHISASASASLSKFKILTVTNLITLIVITCFFH